MTVKELKQQLHEWVDQGDTKVLKMLYAISKVYFTEAAPKSASPLYRLVYTSSRSSSCDQACIDQILDASRKNNPNDDITGMLLYTEDRFIQILEGPLERIMSTYNRISKDNRHGGSVIRYCEPTEERHFHDWHMGTKSLEGVDYTTDISSEERKLYESMVDGDLTSYKDDGMRVLKTFLAIA